MDADTMVYSADCLTNQLIDAFAEVHDPDDFSVDANRWSPDKDDIRTYLLPAVNNAMIRYYKDSAVISSYHALMIKVIQDNPTMFLGETKL